MTLPLEGFQAVSRRKYRGRKAVVEFTRERDEIIKMLVNFCIREMNSRGVS